MHYQFIAFTLVLLSFVQTTSFGEDFRSVALSSQIEHVQPMTGIVLWSTNDNVDTASIQLEFSYFSYDQIVKTKGEYDWSPVEKTLDDIASRKHQAVLRFHDTYVGKPTGVPAYIKSLTDYKETTANSEKKRTGFPDWSHPELHRFVLEFYTRFAEKYDRDPRIAFLQVGFGLWSEYHIYDGPMKLGKTFPSKEFQQQFAETMNTNFRQTPWMISVDAAGDYTPFESNKKLLELSFGVFDDSFNHARHKQENEPNWNHFGRDRWKIAPTGGEFSFFETRDQKEALSLKGPHGIPFEKQADYFHLTFIIGDDQPSFQKPDRLKQASLACGYRFRVKSFETTSKASRITIENIGIAPLYYDAFPTINNERSNESLKGLLPTQSRTFNINSGGTSPTLTIESDRLVPGQKIEFEADLK